MTERPQPPSLSREEFERRREEREKREKKERQERAERFERESARRAWLEQGGTEAGFEKAWPGMRQEALKDAAREAEEQRRISTAARYRKSF